jgi:hypothetical protein
MIQVGASRAAPARGGSRAHLWVVVVGLALTLFLSFLVPTIVPRYYQATARLILLLPPEARREETNPYLNLPNGLIVLTALVAERPNSDESRALMAAEGLHSRFEIGLDPSNPVLTLSVEGTDPDNVTRTRDWLVGAMEAELTRIQVEEGAPERHVADTYAFLVEPLPDRVGGNRSRTVRAFLAAGVILTMLAGFVASRGVEWRRRR